MDQVNASPAPKASAVEQGKAGRGKASPATKARLVNPNETPDRGPRATSPCLVWQLP
jgi:hypothetical protein